MYPSSSQGLSSSRAFSARASSQPLELINGPPASPTWTSSSYPRGKKPAPLRSHSASSLRFLLPLFSPPAPPPFEGCVGPSLSAEGCSERLMVILPLSFDTWACPFFSLSLGFLFCKMELTFLEQMKSHPWVGTVGKGYAKKEKRTFLRLGAPEGRNQIRTS